MTFVPRARAAVGMPELRRPDWSRLDPRNPALLWLDKNENTDPALLAVVYRALSEIDPRTIATYPDTAPLYVALADHLRMDPHHLVLAPGSDGVIGAVFRAFIEPGDAVVIPSPTYAMYDVYCAMHGAAVRRVDYGTRDGVPFLDPDAVVEAVVSTRPKLVCMPNPDSPTGMVTTEVALRRIAQTALEYGALFLVDEAYFPFYPKTIASWVLELPNVVVARTFSKAWALTGVRLGVGIADPSVAALLQKVRPNYEVNGIAVAMGLKMISAHSTEVVASVERLNAGRNHFLIEMAALGLRTLPAHASFCHVAFGEYAPRVHAALADIVLYREDFNGPCLKGFSRFSATTMQLFDPVIAAIRRVIEDRR